MLAEGRWLLAGSGDDVPSIVNARHGIAEAEVDAGYGRGDRRSMASRLRSGVTWTPSLLAWVLRP